MREPKARTYRQQYAAVQHALSEAQEYLANDDVFTSRGDSSLRKQLGRERAQAATNKAAVSDTRVASMVATRNSTGVGKSKHTPHTLGECVAYDPVTVPDPHSVVAKKRENPFKDEATIGKQRASKVRREQGRAHMLARSKGSGKRKLSHGESIGGSPRTERDEPGPKRKRPADSQPSRAVPQHPIVLPRLSADAQDDRRRVDEALKRAKERREAEEEAEQARHEAEERRAEEEEAATADAAAEAQRVAEEAAARAGELQRAADAAAAQRAMVTEYNKIRTQVNEMHEEYRQRNAGRNPRRRDLPDTYQALAARYEELKKLLPGISDLAAAAKAAESADGGV